MGVTGGTIIGGCGMGMGKGAMPATGSAAEKADVLTGSRQGHDRFVKISGDWIV